MVKRIGDTKEFDSMVERFYSDSIYDNFRVTLDMTIKQLKDDGVFDSLNLTHELSRRDFMLMVSEKSMIDMISWKKIVASMREVAKSLQGLPCLYRSYKSKHNGTYTSVFTGEIYRQSSSSGTMYGFEAEGSEDIGENHLFINYWDLV